MNTNTEKQFAGHLCTTCGGAAPEWKCPACGFFSKDFDPLHFHRCKVGGKMQAKCAACDEAESKCACAPTQS